LFRGRLDAHDNYMANSDVWDVIRCGATNGKVTCR
jgi:hypothetical protein